MTDKYSAIEFQIAKLQLNPSDVLCVKIPRNISNTEADRFRSFLKKVLPKSTKVILTDMDIEFTVLTKEMHDNIDNVTMQNKG